MNDAELVEKYGAMLLRAEAERDALRARVAKLEGALMAMLDDWDNLCEGGMMKGVNGRITAARAALKDAPK